jgi:hypothetical protein
MVTNNQDSGAGSLRAEIAAASPGDIIVFDLGQTSQTILLTSDELFINKSLTIQGPGADLLTISGGNTWRVFEVSGNNTTGPTVQLSGLTITGGNGNARSGGRGFGGGIMNENGSTLTISGCIVSNNHIDEGGGGICNSDAWLNVINSTLSGNTASNSSDGGAGGALYSIGGPVSLTGCTLSNNTAYDGGAIFLSGGPMTISGCTLSDNFTSGGVTGWMTPGAGSAVYNANTPTTVTVTHGHTTTTTTNLTISNSTFSGNYVEGWWGDDTIAGPWTNGGGTTFN